MASYKCQLVCVRKRTDQVQGTPLAFPNIHIKNASII